MWVQHQGGWWRLVGTSPGPGPRGPGPSPRLCLLQPHSSHMTERVGSLPYKGTDTAHSHQNTLPSPEPFVFETFGGSSFNGCRTSSENVLFVYVAVITRRRNTTKFTEQRAFGCNCWFVPANCFVSSLPSFAFFLLAKVPPSFPKKESSFFLEDGDLGVGDFGEDGDF